MTIDRYPLPDNEKERLEALHSYDILGSLPEEQYDAIVRLASYICQVPLAFITFLDSDRQWIKSRRGLDIESMPRADSFCRYTILEDKVYEIPDITKDKIFADSPFVTGGPEVKFYAGAPLVDPDGYRLGSICVMDTKPRELNDEQRDALRTLASEVISHLVLGKQKKALEENLLWHKEFYNLFNSSPEIHIVTDQELIILLVNEAVTNILGYKPQETIGQPIWKYFPEDKREQILEAMYNDAINNPSFEIETPIRTANGDFKWISWSVKAFGEKWYTSGRDVTEHKRITEELKLLSLVASKVINGIVISNADDKVVWINDGFERITGYKSSDVFGLQLREVLKGTLPENVPNAKLDELIRNRQSYEVDLLITRKDGEKIWISIINSVIRNEEGEVDKQIRVIIDINDRKRTERDLEILSSAAEKSPSGILIRDKDTNIIWMNEALEKITGYKLEEMMGRTFGQQLIGPETDKEALLAAVELMKQHKPYELEAKIYHRSGKPVWVYISNSPYFNEAGNIERNIMVALDITERKRAEEEVKLLSLVASNTLSGVVINDREGQVEWVNSAFTKITGYTAADVSGNHLGDVLKGELTDISIIEKARELSKNKQSFEVDLLVYRKDGQQLWVSVINSVILDQYGEVDKYIEVIIDITAKKKVEEELIKAKEEALALSNAKDMFMSVMSHEIRTPLNAVIGISHLLMEDNPSETQVENLDILQFSAENLLTLINDLLDFTKIETGNVELERVETNLREIVHGVISSMQYKTGSKHIYLEESVGEDVPEFVLGDKTRLTQVMLNLVGNAVKFTDEGGVRVDLKVIEQSEKDVRIRFAVTDTGIGIAQNKLSAIFESFKQAELDTTRKYGGTGLGLPIAKRLIELHDSRINVDSIPGQGTTFWFTITFKKVAGGLTNKNNQVESGLNLHALVVDDNQINRLLINKVLKKWGGTADFAENGQQAVDMITANQNYDVVLMDIHMPVMGGLEATQTVRAMPDNYYQQLPIIALTASMLNNQMSQISEAGMNDYVLKPFDPKALFDKLSKFQKQ